MDAKGSIRVILIEDDPDWQRGLTSYINKQPDMHIIGHASSGEKAVELIQQLEPDVVLMDIMLSETPQGIWATAEISQCSTARVIMLTSMEEKELIFEAFKAGAVDYIVKSSFEDIPGAVRAAHSNRSPIHPAAAEKMREEFRRLKQMELELRVRELQHLLTPMEVQVLSLIHQGLTQTEIADTFFISIRTVKVHVGNILKKLGESSSKDAALKAKNMGII
jgi:DNA-binding NarL/FixJ family response regulator